jgi:hypothetical protein
MIYPETRGCIGYIGKYIPLGGGILDLSGEII